MKSIRYIAADILLNVVDNGRSLSHELPAALAELDPEQHAFLQQLVYGSVRYYFALDELINQLVEDPLRDKERLLHMVLAIGIYQLWQLQVAEYAAINETVAVTLEADRQWATGLVNGTLRRFQREQVYMLANLRRAESMPGWLNKRLRQAWPEQYHQICADSNQLGPMSLRVNQRHSTRAEWLALANAQGFEALACANSEVGVTLTTPAPVQALPGFLTGVVSVQDEAAQLCAQLLNVSDGERVLDACAAPGGKTGHLLESATIDLTALDVDPKRLDRVAENLGRLNLSAQLTAADAGDVSSWWDGEPFDAILVDAPCSGTGVIRRHPDIKLLRKNTDIKALGLVQKNLLTQLWGTLKPGGRLLYATCSILPDENSLQVSAFLAAHTDARLAELPLTGDVTTPTGVQWLPQAGGHDGFFYALLHKAG